jgi:hypothetical protein
MEYWMDRWLCELCVYVRAHVLVRASVCMCVGVDGWIDR